MIIIIFSFYHHKSPPPPPEIMVLTFPFNSEFKKVQNTPEILNSSENYLKQHKISLNLDEAHNKFLISFHSILNSLLFIYLFI